MATLIHYKIIPLSLLPTIGAFESLGELRAPQYTSVKDDNINRLMIHWVGWEESFIGAESFFSLIISHFLLSCSPSDFAQSQDSCRFRSPVACWWERTVSSAYGAGKTGHPCAKELIWTFILYHGQKLTHNEYQNVKTSI